MRTPRLLLALLATLSLQSPRAAQAETLALTKAQFQLFREYQDAAKDERVLKMKEKDRLPAIAKNFKVKLPELEAAIAAGEKEGGQVESASKKAIEAAFAGTPLEGKVKEVTVDATKGHVVGSILWSSDGTKADEEACWAALKASAAAPLVSTFVLQANGPGDKKLYGSVIGADRAANIKEAQIIDFATTRYVRLFEKREVVAP